MKKIKHRIILTALLAITALTFTACGNSFDPVLFVKGNLDYLYHDIYDETFINSLGDG